MASIRKGVNTGWLAIFLLNIYPVILPSNASSCEAPLGMQDGRITDNQLSAVTEEDRAYRARLRVGDGWGGKGVHDNPSITDTFADPTTVTAIRTQGKRGDNNEYVSRYHVEYMIGGVSGVINSNRSGNALFAGNSDGNTEVFQRFQHPVRLSKITIIPTRCNEDKCILRFELYGCESYWNYWGQWGSCSVPCGGGRRSRFRSCNGDTCPGVGTENGDCNTSSCPYWTSWGPWRDCSVSCGGGRRSRSRYCNRDTCRGLRTDIRDCNIFNCPTTTNQPRMMSTSRQTSTSKMTTTTDISRVFSFSHTQAPASTFTAQTYWNNWGPWSSCPVSCGGGTRSRSRTCNGGICPGVGTNHGDCNTFSCHLPLESVSTHLSPLRYIIIISVLAVAVIILAVALFVVIFRRRINKSNVDNRQTQTDGPATGSHMSMTTPYYMTVVEDSRENQAGNARATELGSNAEHNDEEYAYAYEGVKGHDVMSSQSESQTYTALQTEPYKECRVYTELKQKRRTETDRVDGTLTEDNDVTVEYTNESVVKMFETKKQKH